MKKFIYSALAATALVSVAGAAQAQDSRSFNVVNESLTRNVSTPTFTSQRQIRVGNNWINTNSNGLYVAACLVGNCRTIQVPGAPTITQVTDATFTIDATAPNNTEAATPTVTNAFTITGNVTPDCSFYGSNADGRDINLGTIGVRTGNNEAVSNMFTMRSQATVDIVSSAAGCNTASQVTIAKDNARGLVNDAAVSFDSAQFQNNLPYTIEASFTGVEPGVGASQGSLRTVELGADDLEGSQTSGAWRSNFAMNVVVPTPALGLVAGDYQGTITVTLAAGNLGS